DRRTGMPPLRTRSSSWRLRLLALGSAAYSSGCMACPGTFSRDAESAERSAGPALRSADSASRLNGDNRLALRRGDRVDAAAAQVEKPIELGAVECGLFAAPLDLDELA